jgi:hypothetical protein
MPHVPSPARPKRQTPTLWPWQPDDETPMELAIKARKHENGVLKNLVVKLSAIILRSTTDGK